jgi:Putative peptidoglycan binding domain
MADATEIQKRLSELGFFAGPASGKWGPLSKRALSEFKSQAGLDKNDIWDAATERSLFSEGAPQAVRALAFLGGWSVERGDCGGPGEPPPLRISVNRAESDGGFCQFNSIKSDGIGAWRIDAVCSAGGTSHQAHIRLAVKGAVLHWSSEQPEVLYYRCQNSQ